MTQQFKKDDRVQWNSGSGTATGKIIRKITESESVSGNKVEASQDSPRYLVKNDNTETVTGHKPQALTLVDNSLTEGRKF